MNRFAVFSTAATAVLLSGATLAAASVTLTMDEVPTQAINGLAVTKGNETFTFSNPGDGLLYDYGGPGQITFVQDPSIELGSYNSFSVAFSIPVTFIQFGLAESTLTPLYGAQVPPLERRDIFV